MNRSQFKTDKLRGENGFTLSELILSSGIFIMLALLVGGIFNKGNNLFDVLSAESQVQRNSRRILQTISSTLRQTKRSSVIIPNANQIQFDLPIYQQSSGNCSAFMPPPVSVTNPIPANCGTNTDCQTACGGFTNMSCSCISGNPPCANNSGMCLRTYTYSVSSANGTPQLIASAPGGGESNRILGNQVQSVTFQNMTADPYLQANEIRVSLTTTGNVVSEKRTHTLSMDSVVQVRN